jgi:cysteinyl-tRNA synthetase
MYVCGVTVYNDAHVGHAMSALVFDIIRRYLEYRGYNVRHVMNYTDVDDKIIERASLEGIPADGVTSKYSGAFEEDMEALGVAPPDILSLCTDHITEMIKAVEGLIEKGAAYETDGDVFFAVESFPDYGKLSGRSLEDMRAGERVEVQASSYLANLAGSWQTWVVQRYQNRWRVIGTAGPVAVS